MKYFTLEECIRSETARKNNIDNRPVGVHLNHITESIEKLIDPLREKWEERCKEKTLGSPGITISSGYRSPALNKTVRGSATSAHCHGYAFDLVPVNRKMAEFKCFCREFLKNKAFDQLISEDEDDNGVPRWMHVGYKRPNGEQKKEFLSMKNKKYLPMTD